MLARSLQFLTVCAIVLTPASVYWPTSSTNRATRVTSTKAIGSDATPPSLMELDSITQTEWVIRKENYIAFNSSTETVEVRKAENYRLITRWITTSVGPWTSGCAT